MKHPAVVFWGSATQPEQYPRDGLPEVAFLGRSNVGKSSLLNALAYAASKSRHGVGARALARVSSTPGRTRLVNFFRVGDELYFADLPGYGYAKVSEAERRGFERLVRAYMEGRAALALGVFLVDARHEPGAGDLTLRGYLDALHLPFVLAATKIDKLGRGEALRRVAALRTGIGQGALDVVATSATTRTGIDVLWNVIRAAARGRREA